jgi:hypothetical protein
MDRCYGGISLRAVRGGGNVVLMGRWLRSSVGCTAGGDEVCYFGVEFM